MDLGYLFPTLSSLQQDKVNKAMESTNPQQFTRWVVEIDGVDYSNRVASLEYGSEGGGNDTQGSPGLTIDATFVGGLPRKIHGADVHVTLIVNGVRIRDFTGTALRPEYMPAETRVAGASGGFWLSETKLNADTDYLGMYPSEVVVDVLSRTNTYFGYHVPEVQAPLFTRTGDTQFSATESVSDVLAAVREEAQLVVWDNGENWAVAHQEQDLKVPGEIMWNLEVGVDIDPDEFSIANDTVKYSDVRVIRTLESGSSEDVIPPVPVDHDNDPFPPPRDVSYHLEFTDTTPDAAAIASQMAYDKAEALKHGEHTVQFDTRYIHPYVVRGSTGVITQTLEDDEGKWIRRWLVTCDAHRRRLPEKKGSGSGRATLLEERKVTPTVTPALSGVRTGGVEKRLWGLDHNGIPTIDDTLPYVTISGNIIILDTEVAESMDTHIITGGNNTVVMTDE